MRKLTVIYDPGTGPTLLFDGEIAELVFADNDNSVKVEGRMKKAGGGQGAGLLDLISSASKARTNKTIEKVTGD